jgi:L-amino acid N-acyltransferase YncA
MDIYPKVMALKDKTLVNLRPLTQLDRALLDKFFLSLPEEDKFYLREDVKNPEIVDRFFKDLDYNKIFPIVAIVDKIIIAFGTLYLNTFGFQKFNGEIRISVLNEFQNKGLGTLITAELVKDAFSRGLHTLEGIFSSDQENAMKAFENAGFKKNAVLRKHVINCKNESRDLVLMTNDVNELWKDLENIYYEFEYKRCE